MVDLEVDRERCEDVLVVGLGTYLVPSRKPVGRDHGVSILVFLCD